MAYIYQIKNDINDKIYIGKTEFSIEKRFKEHCSDAFKRTNEKRPLYAAMRKYGIEHFYISLIEETDNPEEREIFWIEYFQSYTNGYNATLGGDGKRYLNYDLIIKTYNKLQNIQKVADLVGCSRDSVKNVLKKYNIHTLSSQEVSKREQIRKPVAKCDKNTGEIIEIYPSIKEAERQNNTQHIVQVCQGKRKTCNGYIWKYI